MVQVVHGSLDQTSFPVAVGHASGMPLRGGAEGWLDAHLHGRLSDRLLVGAYPEQEGAGSYIAAPGMSPPGVLVLGLGQGGEVTAEKVARAMTAATLDWAVTQADALTDTPLEPLELGVASALIGTNPLDGIPLEESVAALVDGVVAAEVLLGNSQRLRSLVRIARLELIERYLDRAQAAVRSLQRLSTGAAASSVVQLKPMKHLTRREGGQRGLPLGVYTSGAWWRLEIRAAEPEEDTPEGYRDLEVTSLGRRARADRLVHRVESATVDELVATAITSKERDEQLGNTLFELLLPGGLKPTLLSGDNVQIVVDPQTAAYPWEALSVEPPSTPGQHHLALRGGMLRQYAERDALGARFTVRRPTGSDVLVIANPPTGDTAPDLPGALKEGRAVVDVLRRSRPDHPDYQVHALLWEEGEAETIGLPALAGNYPFRGILNALYGYEYRIVHIAAHGSYNAEKPARSGILIGPDQYLTATTISEMPVVPEFVFLNCCHSGRVASAGWDAQNGAGHSHQLAASIARALLMIGVRAVVAAGWAVDDDDATAFATKLYSSLLDDGQAFGEAVTCARQAATRTNTWAAYQCYGDPGFRFRSLSTGNYT
ncbi:CHAT domain-containing protein [Humibacillus xanthopallidus]|uniref:CHAT domain-containing protein n=1 Tax=Humibacillus xanthopallidus TaxID=412689 RepID=UPI00163A3179|nr:CHAT domain-containing protein [Humibacillus xanthopallidus]